jgi:hypothetical protein
MTVVKQRLTVVKCAAVLHCDGAESQIPDERFPVGLRTVT